MTILEILQKFFSVAFAVFIDKIEQYPDTISKYNYLMCCNNASTLMEF